jgi:hypothetical protein
MSPVISLRDRAARPRPRLVVDWTWIVMAVVTIALTAAIVPHLRGGHFVDQVRLANQRALDVEVAVASAPDDGWMLLGTAVNHDTVTVREVYDVGDVWYVRFRTTDGEVQQRVTRDSLERDHWTLRVPDFVDHVGASNGGRGN